MSKIEQLFYGGIPVPYTVSWSGEHGHGTTFLGTCPHAKRAAIRQKHNRGAGKPKFGSPHMDRQREAIARDLCDLCGKTLKNRTKVSLSKARPQLHAAKSGDVLQVEPLLHKECAATSIRYCPSLRRDIELGTLSIRQVTRHACQFAIYSAEGTFEITGVAIKAVSHAKVQLIKFIDRDVSWLTSTAAP